MGERSLNDFFEDLKYSHECEDAPCWGQIYKNAFYDFAEMINHRQDGYHQRLGIDRTIILKSSKVIRVDEKARRRHDTGDIMLEYVSNNRTGSLGWVEKPLLCDYIAYAFIPSCICYLLPVEQMQMAWSKNKDRWLYEYGTKEAINDGYKTLNCPVETKKLYSAIGSLLRVRF